MGAKSLPTIRQPAVASGIELLAVHSQGAFAAFGVSCGAAVTTKEDDAVAEVGAFLRGEDQAQLLFYLLGFLTHGQTQTAADADAVGVADDGTGDAVEVAQQQIGGFRPTPGRRSRSSILSGTLPL